ncbi:MAG TPA: T9SS type A sorting domain-containing protein [Lentimicrobium sp.]|nr:T9SS type A sorting domain-containing protein [Lentimicrobium sp.]
MRTLKSITILLYFILTQVDALLSQNSFQVSFSTPNKSEYCNCITEDFEGNLIGVGGLVKIADPSSLGVIWKISNCGDTLSKVFAFGDSLFGFSDIRLLQNGNYKVTGTIGTSYETLNCLQTLELSPDLNIVNRHLTVLPYLQTAYDMHMRKHLQSYYIMISNYGPNSSPPYLSDPYFVKLNSNFDTVFTKQYALDGDQSCTDMLFSPDGSQLWLLSEAYFPELTSACLTQMVVYDTMFNFVRVKTLTDYRMAGQNMAKWITDSTFILGFKYAPLNPHEEDVAFAETDSTFQFSSFTRIGVIDTIDYMAFEMGLDFLSPDSIHYTGTKNMVPDYWPQQPSWIRVGLLDRQLQPLYERFYGGDAQYRAISVIRTSDGGSFISATRYDYLNHLNYNDAFFLKVNSEGLVTNTNTSAICPLNPVLLYPNPGSDHVNMELSWNTASCSVIDMNGKMVSNFNLHKGLNQINTRMYKPGNYLFILNSNDNEHTTLKWTKK